MENQNSNPREGQIIFYTTPEGVTKVEIVYQDETFWLSQRGIAELYGVERSVITKHIGNIFKSNELDENSVCAKIAHTASDGKTYISQFYNLDMTGSPQKTGAGRRAHLMIYGG